MMRLVLILSFLFNMVAAHAQQPVKPEELFAPGQSPTRYQCPTYDGNQFLWQSSCGSGSSGLECHTHVCVNRLCFNPRTCPDDGTQMAVGVGPNGDAICIAAPTGGGGSGATPTPFPTTPPGGVLFTGSDGFAFTNPDRFRFDDTSSLLNIEEPGGSIFPVPFMGIQLAPAPNNIAAMVFSASGNGSNVFVGKSENSQPGLQIVSTVGGVANACGVGQPCTAANTRVFEFDGFADDGSGNTFNPLGAFAITVAATPAPGPPPGFVPGKLDFTVTGNDGMQRRILSIQDTTARLPQVAANCGQLGTDADSGIACVGSGGGASPTPYPTTPPGLVPFVGTDGWLTTDERMTFGDALFGPPGGHALSIGNGGSGTASLQLTPGSGDDAVVLLTATGTGVTRLIGGTTDNAAGLSVFGVGQGTANQCGPGIPCVGPDVPLVEFLGFGFSDTAPFQIAGRVAIETAATPIAGAVPGRIVYGVTGFDGMFRTLLRLIDNDVQLPNLTGPCTLGIDSDESIECAAPAETPTTTPAPTMTPEGAIAVVQSGALAPDASCVSNLDGRITCTQAGFLASFYGIGPNAGTFFDTTNGAIHGDRRANGTLAMPSPVANGELISGWQMFGHDGTDYQRTAQVQVRVDGPVSTGAVPMRWEWYTSLTDAAALVKDFVIYASGLVQAPVAFRVGPTLTPSATPTGATPTATAATPSLTARPAATPIAGIAGNLALDEGHLISRQAAAPWVTSCGTSPTQPVAGDASDSVGTFTVGSVATACTLNFTRTWANAPKCFAAIQTAVAANIFAVGTTETTTSVTFTTATAASISGLTIQYFCAGNE